MLFDLYASSKFGYSISQTLDATVRSLDLARAITRFNDVATGVTIPALFTIRPTVDAFIRQYPLSFEGTTPTFFADGAFLIRANELWPVTVEGKQDSVLIWQRSTTNGTLYIMLSSVVVGVDA